MPLSYDFIDKPPQVQLIDTFFSGPQAQLQAALDTARALLTSGRPLLDTTKLLVGAAGAPGPPAGANPAALARLRGLPNNSHTHFNDHWLSKTSTPPHDWARPAVGDVMRDAYLAAVNAADATNPKRPIETWWVYVAEDEDFEMRVIDSSPDKVNVFVLIPRSGVALGGDPPAGFNSQRFGPPPKP